MWIRLFRAEWQKIIGNRWATGCMIWIFPALAVLVILLLFVGAALSSSFRESINAEPARWTEIAIFPWVIPNNPLGRGLLIGFTAVLFAGEYQWNTWKVVVPRSQRVPLILMKFLTVALFVLFAFTLMSILLTLGMGLLHVMVGASYGPSVDGDVLSNFVEDYGLQMLFAFMTTIIAAGYAAFAAMITRSILGSAITAIVASIGETFLIIPLALLASLFKMDSIMHVYRFVPSWNLINLFSWLTEDQPSQLEMPSGEIVVDSLLFSEVVLACWVVGLIVLTAYLFQRQDITN
jgi:hypothetical protein